MKVYHGSWNCFERFDFEEAYPFATKGAAFYGSTSPLVARNYAYREARRTRSVPYLYCYEVPEKYRPTTGTEVIIPDAAVFSEETVLLSRICLRGGVKNMLWRTEDFMLEAYKKLFIKGYRKIMNWKWKVNTTLYHGTNVELEDISLEQSIPIGFLGKGFYLTSSKLEAAFYAIARALSNGGTPYVYSCCFTGNPKYFKIKSAQVGEDCDDCDIVYQNRSPFKRLRMLVGRTEVAVKSDKAVSGFILLEKQNLKFSKYRKIYLKMYSVMNYLCSVSLRERCSNVFELNFINSSRQGNGVYEPPVIDMMMFQTEKGFAATSCSPSGAPSLFPSDDWNW